MWDRPMNRFPIHHGTQFPDVRFCNLHERARLVVLVDPDCLRSDRQPSRGLHAGLELTLWREAHADAFIPRRQSRREPTGIADGWTPREIHMSDLRASMTAARTEAFALKYRRLNKHDCAALFARLRLLLVCAHLLIVSSGTTGILPMFAQEVAQ